MNILKIVIIESDEEFHLKIHQKFAKELNGNVDVVEITDVGYFLESRSKIGGIDILLVSESLLDQVRYAELAEHVFILTFERKEINRSDGFFNIMKYSSPAEIFNTVMRVANINAPTLKRTEAIMFCSASGNVGKTSLALTVSQMIALKQMVNVLYINLESICAMQAYLKDVKLSDDRLDSAVRSGDSNMLGVIQDNIYTVNHFSYLKPFNDIGASMDISAEDYAFLIKLIKQNNHFDRIILDMSSEVSYRIASVMSECEKVVIVTEQSEYAAFKLDKFLSIVRPDNRFLFVCNKFERSRQNYLNNIQKTGGLRFLEEIPMLNVKQNSELISAMTEQRAVKGLANLLM